MAELTLHAGMSDCEMIVAIALSGKVGAFGTRTAYENGVIRVELLDSAGQPRRTMHIHQKPSRWSVTCHGLTFGSDHLDIAVSAAIEAAERRRPWD